MQAGLFTASALLPDMIKQNESPKVTSATIIRTRETWELFCGLTIQPTFRNATTHSVFPAKCRLKKAAQKFHTGDVSPPRSGKCFLLVEANSLARRPTRSSTQIWRVKGHQHGISALVPQTSYRRETSHWMVVLFLRLQSSTDESNLSSNKSGCYRLRKVIVELCNKICIQYNALCIDPRKWSHSSCKTDLRVCALTVT